MAQVPVAEKPSRSRSNWWSDRRIKILATIVVPLTVAVIGILKFPGGSGEKQTANNFTLITDVTVIENQYQQSTGQPLQDENIKRLIQSAVNLAKAGQNEASRRLFEQLANSVPVPAVYSNIGSLAAEKGDLQGSRQAYQHALEKDPTYKPALQNLQALARLEQPSIREVKGREAEPNNDINHTNLIPIGAKIAGSISDPSDTDFFQFKTPPGPRDIYQASLENGSTTLHPGITVFDGNRHQLTSWECTSDEAIAHLDCQFSADAGSTYYVQVWQRNGTAGAYSLLVTPLKRYDTYEPNDDFSQARQISLGNTVEANIMDPADKDFYFLKTGTIAGKLTATIENGSTTLHPAITVFDGNRHQLTSWECTSDEALMRLECPFSAEAGSTYYLQVWPRSNTAGAYKLIVK